MGNTYDTRDTQETNATPRADESEADDENSFLISLEDDGTRIGKPVDETQPRDEDARESDSAARDEIPFDDDIEIDEAELAAVDWGEYGDGADEQGTAPVSASEPLNGGASDPTSTTPEQNTDGNEWSDFPDTIRKTASVPTDAFPDTATPNPQSPAPRTDDALTDRHGTWFSDTTPTEDGLDVIPLDSHHDSDGGVTTDSMFVVEDPDTGDDMYVTVYEPGTGGQGKVADAYGVVPVSPHVFTVGHVELASQTVTSAAASDIIQPAVETTGIPRVKGHLEFDDGGEEAWVAVEGIDGETWRTVTDGDARRVDETQMMDVMATQLLIGNRDIHTSNVLLEDNGDVWVPDIDRSCTDLSGSSLNSDLIQPAQYVQEARHGHVDPSKTSQVKQEVYEHTKEVANEVLESYDGTWHDMKQEIMSNVEAVSGGSMSTHSRRHANQVVNNILAFSDSDQRSFKDEDALEQLSDRRND